MSYSLTAIPHKYNIKVSKEFLLTLIIFIVLPLYSVPFILLGMWKRKKWAFSLWALFMGLVGILVPPTGDFYRYTLDYELYKGLEWGDFLFIAALKNELMLPTISYFIGRLDLNFDISRFIYNFLGYYYLGKIYYDITQNNSFLQEKKTSFYALGFFMSFSISIFCFRYFLSAIFFVYGSYQIVYKEKNKGWLFIGLAIFNHLTYVIQAAILFLQRFNLFRFNRKLVVLLVLISFCIDSSIIIKIFNLLPIDFVSSYISYLDGYWANDFLEDHSLKYKIQMFIGNIINYFCIIVYILQYKKENNKYNSINNGMLLLTVVSTPFATINGRFIAVMMYFIKIHILYTYNNSRKFLNYLIIMFWLSMLSNLMGLWAMRRQIYISDFNIMLYSTSLNIFNHTYDNNWIDNNVSEDGSFLQINF